MYFLLLLCNFMEEFNSPTPHWPTMKYEKTWPTVSQTWMEISYSSNPTGTSNKSRKSSIIIISVSSCIVFVLVCSFILLLVRRRRKLNADNTLYKTISNDNLLSADSNGSIFYIS